MATVLFIINFFIYLMAGQFMVMSTVMKYYKGHERSEWAKTKIGAYSLVIVLLIWPIIVLYAIVNRFFGAIMCGLIGREIYLPDFYMRYLNSVLVPVKE